MKGKVYVKGEKKKKRYKKLRGKSKLTGGREKKIVPPNPAQVASLK